MLINVGKWAFIVGIVLAILTGFFAISYIGLVMFILGLIVGFLNINDKEVHDYLVAVIALLVIGVSAFQSIDTLNGALGSWMETIVTNFMAFVAASGLVVAIKAILQLGKVIEK